MTAVKKCVSDIVYKLRVTNVATVRIFEVMCYKLDVIKLCKLQFISENKNATTTTTAAAAATTAAIMPVTINT